MLCSCKLKFLFLVSICCAFKKFVNNEIEIIIIIRLIIFNGFFSLFNYTNFEILKATYLYQLRFYLPILQIEEQ
ncbi:hypothetical protein C4S76_08500 [Apibacter adventoris]|nr:hypothetical protein C4S76_08500 [Apibacter adventoris]